MSSKFKAQAKGIFNAKLPFEILEDFTPLEKDEILDKGGCIEYVDDTVLKIDLKEKMGAIVSSIICFVTIIFLIFLGLRTEEGFNHPVAIIFMILAIVSFLYFFVKIFIDKKSLIILDRENGMFSFPYRLQKYKKYTTKFNEAIVYWMGTGGVTDWLTPRLETIVAERVNDILDDLWGTNIRIGTESEILNAQVWSR